jgi:hypothetical protein
MLSNYCIYLSSIGLENYEIWLDFGKYDELRDFYLYKDNKLLLKSYFCFSNKHLEISGTHKKRVIWNCEKYNFFSLKINGFIYTIDKYNLQQVILFNKLVDFIFH